MAELDKPLNPLELGDGEKVSFTVVRWEPSSAGSSARP